MSSIVEKDPKGQDINGVNAVNIKVKTEQPHGKNQNVTSGKKFLFYIRIITVEPAAFFYAFIFGVQFPTEQALIYQRVCTERFKNDTWICDNLYNETMIENENLVQADAAEYFLYGQFCVGIPMIIMTFLYGIVSDRYTRKYVILFPFIGYAIESVLFILLAEFPDLTTDVYYAAKLGHGIWGGKLYT